jgi:hypothetical protein
LFSFANRSFANVHFNLFVPSLSTPLFINDRSMMMIA